MGEKPNGALLSPLGAPRIKRHHGSSARCVRDPMTQGYWPGWVVGHVTWRQGSCLGARDCSLLLFVNTVLDARS